MYITRQVRFQHDQLRDFFEAAVGVNSTIWMHHIDAY